MATKDKTTGAHVLPANGLGKVYVLHNYVDFTVAANQIAQNETMDIFDIPANTLVLEANMRIMTADSDVNDIDIGISGATADGFLDGSDAAADSTGWKRDTSGEGYTAPAGFISESAAVVMITNKDVHTINQAKIHFYAICVDLSDDDTGI